MTNLEWLVNNRNYVDSTDSVCILSHISRYHQVCDDKNCFECEFFKNNKECLKELLQEQEEKIKLKQWEYDILKHCDNARRTYIQMKHLGYFKGTSDDLTIDEILSDYIIVSDDYEGFEEMK